MSHALIDRYQDPEQVIAVLNRRRHMKAWFAVVAIVVAFCTLLAASAAMYSEDPKAKLPMPTSQ